MAKSTRQILHLEIVNLTLSHFDQHPGLISMQKNHRMDLPRTEKNIFYRFMYVVIKYYISTQNHNMYMKK